MVCLGGPLTGRLGLAAQALDLAGSGLSPGAGGVDLALEPDHALAAVGGRTHGRPQLLLGGGQGRLGRGAHGHGHAQGCPLLLDGTVEVGLLAAHRA